MSTKQESITDPRDNDLVIVIESLSPERREDDAIEYDWSAVRVFLNGKEIDVFRLELLLDSSTTDESGRLKYPAPVLRVNDFV